MMDSLSPSKSKGILITFSCLGGKGGSLSFGSVLFGSVLLGTVVEGNRMVTVWFTGGIYKSRILCHFSGVLEYFPRRK